MNINHSAHLNAPSEVLFAEVDLFLSLAVITGVVTLYMVYLMIRPLVEEGEISAEEWTRLEDDSLALLRQRDRVIAELKEIEFEAAMNKLDAHDLSQLRGQYEREALRLIEELEVKSSNYSEQLAIRSPSSKKAKSVKETPHEKPGQTEVENQLPSQDQVASALVDHDTVISEENSPDTEAQEPNHDA